MLILILVDFSNLRLSDNFSRFIFKIEINERVKFVAFQL